MKHRKDLLLACFVPLVACVVLCIAAQVLLRRSKDNWRECEACARTAESLAPYLKTVHDYDAAKARLLGTDSVLKAPELPIGVPSAGRSSERDPVIDGWAGLHETFSWPSLKIGQAFAVLESFSSARPWRIAAVRLKAMPDGENASLSVTLECAEPAEGRRE